MTKIIYQTKFTLISTPSGPILNNMFRVHFPGKSPILEHYCPIIPLTLLFVPICGASLQPKKKKGEKNENEVMRRF